ncbi:Ribosome biogenesis regulatory protein (RRS1) [Giardia muris]|uniref:Ribosome biogenesis regulatory protein n=1 Tax=Giardia muris TaxID=5742 RepID=A0A4Z1SQ68_GIAMU|nr:Ribosome biogenesis regulatory protein (RRS1) [Giardia muris]TNJ27042.1 Ribosome biogenesis regulatory protein (RRS1) [Giardia muris]|eukprot:TNJ27035.1 Ribosome biogenesis regulatory protein (RRS1) [Giardia muris]
MQFDLHYLMATDPTPLPPGLLEPETDEHQMMDVAVRTVAALCKEFVQLPRVSSNIGLMGTLPPPILHLPREKPLPKPREPTRWELFAKTKGIKKRKRSRLVYDEKVKEYRPRYGRNRRTDNTTEYDPIIPAKEGVDDYPGAKDAFTVVREARLARIAKNKAQRAANLRRGGRR